MEQLRTNVIILVTAGSLLGLTGCPLDREGKKPPSDCQGETAGISLRLRVEGPNTQANQSYQTEVTWQGEIVAPDPQNTCGNTDSFNITKTYGGTRDVSGDYVIDQPSSGQRPGEWKFTVTALGSSSTCNKTLTAGDTKLVGFIHQQQGC